MAGRAYFLIKLEEGIDQEEFVEKVLKLEDEQGEVESLDPVMGEHDFVLSMEAEVGPEKLEDSLKENITGIKDIKTLKVIGLERKVKATEEKLKKMMTE